jgi:hypothetical protein
MLPVQDQQRSEEAVNVLKGLGLGLVLALAVSMPAPEASAQDCKPCARLPSVLKCVRCSVDSPQAKRTGYSESGIRRWCEENQPLCSGPKGKKP